MIILPSSKSMPLKPYYKQPTTWDIGIRTNSANQTFGITISGTTPNITVDWGDGTIETFTTTGVKNHSYVVAKSYTVKILGSFASDGNIQISTNPSFVRTTSAIPPISGWRITGADLTGPFYRTFYNCSNLTYIPSNLFMYYPNIRIVCFSQTFQGCSSLRQIPPDLFKYNTLINSGFNSTFNGCTSLKEIPSDLFRYNTQINAVADIGVFYNTFYNCSGLTTLPEDLFRYNTLITTYAFYSTFRYCSGLTTIPANLFRYNVNLTTDAFNTTFSYCDKISSIPIDLFRYNTAITTRAFNNTFLNAGSLLNGFAIDADLLRYNINLAGTSTAVGMFSNITLNTVAYSNLLISLDTYLTQSNLGFGAGLSKYNSSAATARANLVARGWSIVDGGLA